VPLNSPVYRDIDIIAGYGLIDANLSSTKPFTRIEVGRLLSCAARNWENQPEEQKRNSSLAGLMDSLEAKYREEFDLTQGKRGSLADYVKPLDEFSLTYRYLQGPFSIYNSEGIKYHDGSNLMGELQSHARFWNGISFYIQPLFLYNEKIQGRNGDEETDFYMHKAYVKFGTGNFEVEIGRDSLWWGPSYHGSLLMSNNAMPFDLVKLSNPHPTLLPWVLKYLGPFKFNLIFSELEEDRPIPEPYLYGLRFDFTPHPIVEIGLSHVVIFGGRGHRDLSFSDYPKILYSNRNRDGTKLDSNQQMAMDIAVKAPDISRLLPLGSSAKLYAEIGAEDTGRPPDRRAYLLGATLYDFLMLRTVQVTVEYVDTSPKSVPTAWYQHASYPATYKGDIFGHHVGTDAKDLFAEVSFSPRQELLVRLNFDREERGASLPTPERHYQGNIEIQWDVNHGTRLDFRYGYEEISNLNHFSGEEQENHLAEVQISIQF
jgi:hypothetical protein